MRKNVVLRYLLGFGPGIPDARPSLATKSKRLIFIAFVLWLAWTSPSSPLMAQSKSETFVFESTNKSLDETLKALGKASGFLFTYSMEQVGRYPHVSIAKGNRNIEKTLSILLENTHLSYRIKGKNILVFSKEMYRKTSSDALNGNEDKPNGPITGIVKDGLDNPLLGVTVRIKNTTNAVTTNAEGEYTLEASQGDVLVYTFIGFTTKEEKVTEKMVYNVVLHSDSQLLDEVQIIGYGTTSKKLNTGSVATAKGDEIKDRPVSDITQAIQGKLAGVAVVNTSAGLGSPTSITVRGVNSISSGNNPLIVIDGVIMNSQPGGLIFNDNAGDFGPMASTTYETGFSTLNYINPSDIQSIDVLKDADATGIYGSRGTNGVILITTKKATMGNAKWTVNISSGWKSPTVLTRRMNTEQYLQMRKDAFATGNMESPTSVINPITPTTDNAPDLLTWSQTAYTNFPKMEYGSAASNFNADVSMSGGTKEFNYIVSGAYFKKYDNYMFKPYQERMLGRMQINHTSADNKLNMHMGATLSIENQKFSNATYAGGSSASLSTNSPNFPLYNNDGSLHFGYFSFGMGYQNYNPLGNESVSSRSKTNNVLLDADVSYTLVKGLVAKVQASFASQSNAVHTLFPSAASAASSVQDVSTTLPFGQHPTKKYTSVNLEPQLSYNRSISKATITVLAGGTIWNSKTENTYINVSNPGSDDLLGSFASGNPTTTYSNNTEQKFQSLFGRLNVDWDKKYILNVNFRRDGSSRFAPENRFGNFASGGFAWLFSNESFVKESLPFISYGKLRGSYGTTGNNNIPDYQYFSLLKTPDQFATNAYPGYKYYQPIKIDNYPNHNIKWETTTKNDFGLELGFLDNRFMISGVWYRSITSDLLTTLPLGEQSGFASYYGNFPGKVQNTGWEFELTTQNLAPNRPVKWTTKFNITFNKNILKSYPNLANSTYAETLQVGRALPSLDYTMQEMEMPFHYTGVDPATGLPQFKDLDNDGGITYADAFTNIAWIGSTQPTIWGGMTNSLTYKGFTLDIFLQFSNGLFTKWNYGYTGIPTGSLYNPSSDMVGNYWMKPGDVKKYPRLYTGESGNATYTTNPLISQYSTSTAALYKGYYIRLKNVQLSYSLPKKWASKVKMTNATIYMSGENLAVYCPEKLFKDPETVNRGFNGNSLLRTITTGIRFQF